MNLCIVFLPLHSQPKRLSVAQVRSDVKRNPLCPCKLMGEKTLQKGKIIGKGDDKHC